MGVWDAITEVLEAAMPWGEVEAEAPAEETQETQVGLLHGPRAYGGLGNWPGVPERGDGILDETESGGLTIWDYRTMRPSLSSMP